MTSRGRRLQPPGPELDNQRLEHRIASYNKGCRCETCREAARNARRRARAKAKEAA